MLIFDCNALRETAHILDFRWSCFSLSRENCTALHKKYKALHNGIDNPKIRNAISNKEIHSQNKKYKALHDGSDNPKIRNSISKKEIPSQNKKYNDVHDGIDSPKIRNAISDNEIQYQNKKYNDLHGGINNPKIGFPTFCPSKCVILTEKLSYSDWRKATCPIRYKNEPKKTK